MERSDRGKPVGESGGHESPDRKDTDFLYSGSELAAVGGARNYYRWLIERFTPYLGPSVIELGAGIGTFAEFLLAAPGVDQLVAIEPAGNTFPLLEKRLARYPNAVVIKGYLEAYVGPPADSLVAVNVLEHVLDDAQLLRLARDRVRPEGTLLLFVPALRALFGSLDHAFEHFRRYDKPQLRARIEAAGWTVEKISYMNIAGIVPWLVAGKIFRRTSISSREARTYDRFVVPLTAAVERRFEMPIGQSLLAVARRRSV